MLLLVYLPATEPVNQDADIIFLMDSSTGVTLPQYDMEKNLVGSLARHFIISPLGPRAAVMTYSSRTHTVIEFNGFINVPDFIVKMNDSPFLGGQRRVAQALQNASRMFKEKSRVGIKILVLLTAGRYYTGDGASSLSVAMQPLKDLGVHVYVVGIGSGFNSKSYQPLVGAPEDVFSVPSFTSLSGYQHGVARQLRLRTTASKYFVPHLF